LASFATVGQKGVRSGSRRPRNGHGDCIGSRHPIDDGGKFMASSRKPARTGRFDQLSGEEIQARWKGLLPKFLKGFALFGSATVLIYALNHFFILPQRITDIANVAFQICSIFAVCFTFLSAMGLYYSGGSWKQSPK
jgi:hypothetical protein